MKYSSKTEKYLYVFSIVCGLVPLFTGVLVFALWLPDQNIDLMAAGLQTIDLGLISVSVGVTSLAAYAISAYRSGTRPGKITQKTLGSLSILASGFAAAAILVPMGFHLATSYLVTVENRTKQPVEDFHLVAADETITYGKLQPNSKENRRFRIKNDGYIEYRFKMDGEHHSGLVEGYVTKMQGGKLTILIEQDGELRVRNHRYHTKAEKKPEQPSQRQDWTLPCMIPG